ncbi:MAG TPA: uroporphyrinogen-III C-methyltransferase [Gammaproteobacteria bacterium]
MTEEALPAGHDHDAPAPPAVPPEPRPVWPRLAAGVAFALALLASAGVAFLWWQYREFYVALHEADVELEASLERIRATQRALSDRLDALGAAVDAARERAERLEELPARMAELERQLGDVPARLAAAERQLAAVQGGSFDAQATWLKAEAEYYLAVANAELELAGRWDNAATALELADGRLRALADPAVAPVRRQIAADLLALESVTRPDLERVVFELASLADRVDSLPLRRVGGAEADEPPLEDVEPGLGRLVTSARRALASLVTIERRDDAESRVTSAERRALAHRELRTELSLARAGALQRDRAAYAASLSAAAGLLERDFDLTDPGVRAAAALVDELAAVDVSPPRPDISRSLSLLRNLESGSD